MGVSQTVSQTDRRTDRQTDRQTGRQAETVTWIEKNKTDTAGCEKSYKEALHGSGCIPYQTVAA